MHIHINAHEYIDDYKYMCIYLHTQTQHTHAHALIEVYF